MNVFNDYLKKLPADQQAALKHVVEICRQQAPDAEAVITYGMPGFKYKGKYLLAFAAFKDHLSLFPGAEPIEKFKDELKNYKLSKGTVQFTIDHPLSDKLLKNIILECIKRNDRTA